MSAIASSRQAVLESKKKIASKVPMRLNECDARDDVFWACPAEMSGGP
jgi:hypothetical protein